MDTLNIIRAGVDVCKKRYVFFCNVGDLLIVLRIDTGASLIQRHNAEPKYKDMPDAGFKDRCRNRLHAGLPCRIVMVESLGSSSCLLFEVKSANFSFMSSCPQCSSKFRVGQWFVQTFPSIQQCQDEKQKASALLSFSQCFVGTIFYYLTLFDLHFFSPVGYRAPSHVEGCRLSGSQRLHQRTHGRDARGCSGMFRVPSTSLVRECSLETFTSCWRLF